MDRIRRTGLEREEDGQETKGPKDPLREQGVSDFFFRSRIVVVFQETEILSNVIPEETRRTPLTNTLPNPTRPRWINCAGRFPVQPSLLMSGWQLAEQGSACVDQIRPCLTRATRPEKMRNFEPASHCWIISKRYRTTQF